MALAYVHVRYTMKYKAKFAATAGSIYTLHSRRSALEVPTTSIREICSLHTNACAVIQSSRPSHGVLRVHVADDTLSTVEMYSAVESCQANLKIELHDVHHHVRDFVVESSRWSRYRASWRYDAMKYCCSVSQQLQNFSLTRTPVFYPIKRVGNIVGPCR